MEVVYAILLIFSAFRVDKTSSEQPQRDKRNLIIGGNEISITEAPYQVALFINGEFLCGGSIIGARWILTAGHCVPGKVGETRAVRAGSRVSTSGGVLIKILQAFRHPDFNETKTAVVYNDVALLWLQEPLHFDGNRLSCISLPAQGERLPTGSVGKVSGWGRTDALLGGPTTDVLRAVNTTVLPFAQCQAAYATLYTNEEIQYCIGDAGIDKGSCSGDSGGPFAVGNKIYGVASWGTACTGTKSPAVYTDVSAFIQWIQQTVVSVSSLDELNCT